MAGSFTLSASSVLTTPARRIGLCRRVFFLFGRFLGERFIRLQRVGILLWIELADASHAERVLVDLQEFVLLASIDTFGGGDTQVVKSDSGWGWLLGFCGFSWLGGGGLSSTSIAGVACDLIATTHSSDDGSSEDFGGFFIDGDFDFHQVLCVGFGLLRHMLFCHALESVFDLITESGTCKYFSPNICDFLLVVHLLTDVTANIIDVLEFAVANPNGLLDAIEHDTFGRVIPKVAKHLTEVLV